MYHQWLAVGFNTVRFGAFTEIVHAFSVFMTLLTMLLVSLLTYFLLPRGTIVVPETDEAEEMHLFYLNVKSFFTGIALTSGSCFVLMLIFELTLRCVQSQERKPGNAYYTLIKESKVLCGMLNKYKEFFDRPDHASDNLEIEELFLQEKLLMDSPSIVQRMKLNTVGSITSTGINKTKYVKDLLHYLVRDMTEDEMIELKIKGVITDNEPQSIDSWYEERQGARFHLKTHPALDPSQKEVVIGKLQGINNYRSHLSSCLV